MENTELYARLAAQVEHPEPWRPEPGDTLVGEIVRWELVELNELNNLSLECDVCVIRDEAGKEWAVWLWHYKLRLALAGDADRKPDGDCTNHAAQPGDWVAVNFRGKREKATAAARRLRSTTSRSRRPKAEPRRRVRLLRMPDQGLQAELLEAALEYAGRGLPVFPCNGKRPLHRARLPRREHRHGDGAGVVASLADRQHRHPHRRGERDRRARRRHPTRRR